MTRAEAITSAGRRVSVALLVTFMTLIGGFRPVTSGAATTSPRGGTDVSPTSGTTVPYRGGRTRPTVSIRNASVREGDSGTRTLSFPVIMSDTSSSNVTVSYATAAGTATQGTDYVSASGKLTIAAGKTSGHVFVRVLGDRFLERDETLFVNLSRPSGAYLAGSAKQGRGLIRNDDTKVHASGHFSGGTVHVGGRFSPSGAASHLTVSLFRKKNGRFVRIGRRRVTLTAAGDVDGDGIPDSRYSTAWSHMPHGTYRVVAKFPGNTSFRSSSAAYVFKG